MSPSMRKVTYEEGLERLKLATLCERKKRERERLGHLVMFKMARRIKPSG